MRKNIVFVGSMMIGAFVWACSSDSSGGGSSATNNDGGAGTAPGQTPNGQVTSSTLQENNPVFEMECVEVCNQQKEQGCLIAPPFDSDCTAKCHTYATVNLVGSDSTATCAMRMPDYIDCNMHISSLSSETDGEDWFCIESKKCEIPPFCAPEDPNHTGNPVLDSCYAVCKEQVKKSCALGAHSDADCQQGCILLAGAQGACADALTATSNCLLAHDVCTDSCPTERKAQEAACK